MTGREATGQGKEIGGKRCGKRAACGVIAALSGRRAALYAKCIGSGKKEYHQLSQVDRPSRRYPKFRRRYINVYMPTKKTLTANKPRSARRPRGSPYRSAKNEKMLAMRARRAHVAKMSGAQSWRAKCVVIEANEPPSRPRKHLRSTRHDDTPVAETGRDQLRTCSGGLQ